MDKIIDRLFKRLSATYGTEWDRAIASAPIADVRTVWAHELSVFKNSLGRIAWALENLPERCPNAIVFKNLCRAAPAQPGHVEERTAIQHASEPIDPEIQRMILDALRKPAEKTGMKDWAHALRKRHEAGERLNANQIRCYKNALGLHAGGMQI